MIAYKQTYYPEADGRRCELVTAVPVAPGNAALGELIRALPRERRALWHRKNKTESAPTDAGARG